MILILSALLAQAHAEADAPQPQSPAEVTVCAAAAHYEDFICYALGHQQKGRFVEAAESFEKAAAALPPGDPRKDRALAAAGNMWIAAGQPGKAALALDRAIAGGGLQAEQRGEALLDRARAAEAQNDLKTARAKLGEAAATIAEDPFYWYFSAALAIRENDKATAQTAINRALSLAPEDPTILFEAGHAAHFNGDLAKAKDYWTRAASADPDGASGKSARKALALLAPGNAATK